MQTILVDARFYDEIKSVWGKDYRILPSYVSKLLAEPVCAHPDMTICSLGGGIYVCSPDSFDYYSRILADCDIKLVQGATCLKSNYPEDIAYNVARAGKCLIGHEMFSDPVLLQIAKENGLLFYPTKQGYAKCSSCIISENALITSDPSIVRSAQEAGIDVLKIRPGYVNLKGYDCGFIGGVCGVTPKGELLCFGDMSSHPDYIEICDFLKKHNVALKDLKNRPLEDTGTILSIYA
ncbi:MAG: hypothetical protein IKW59_06115 [Clostridia bacterium]|nr:hypothetical protein [Clostridia bacterium]